MSHPRSFTLAFRDCGSHGKPEAILIGGFDHADPRISSAGTRVSILYPFDSENFREPSGEFFIGFLALKRPLDFLSGLSEELRRSTLFGCGICCFVLISTARRVINSVIESAGESLYAWEVWRINGEAVEDVEDRAQDQKPIALKQIALNVEATHEPSTAWLLAELYLNLNRLYQNAQRYAPYVVGELEALANDVNELIAEIRADETVQRDAYRSLADQNASSPHPNHQQFLFAKKRLNANVDLLVQLNSASVYAYTQAFAGVVPIRLGLAHISQHSLLGVGTAWRAIQRTCSCVFETFRDARFPERLRSALDSSDSAKDVHLSDMDQESSELRLNTRIVHFSARNGFGESDAAITCPSQAVQVCDQPEWSLCTATHEILHTHVRELVAMVFCESKEPDVPLPFDESLATIIAGYNERVKAERKGTAAPLSGLKELRFGLIQYALEYRANVLKAKDKYDIEDAEFDSEIIEVTVTLPSNTETTFRAFKKGFRLMEETIVHILDLHYFFAGDRETFSDSLWYSWSIVPSVMEKLNWYVLRTLLALASTSTGTHYERLAEAVKVLSDSLNKIVARQNGGSVIAKEVLRRLNPSSADVLAEKLSSKFLMWLDLLFPACLPLVDLTTKFFVSPELTKKFSDARRDGGDDDEGFQIDFPNFDERGIAKPLALIHDRLRKGLDRDGMRSLSNEEVARFSAIVLLALSSEPEPKKEII